MGQYLCEVIPPGDWRLGDTATVGAKAANLSRSLQLGYNVPAFWTLHVQSNATAPDVSSASMTVSETIDGFPFRPSDLESGPLAQALEAIKKMPGRNPNRNLMIRSSSQYEDTQGSTTAGQYLSVICHDHPKLLSEALNRVWSAMRSTGPSDNRLTAPKGGVSIMISSLVDAQLSGVCFSVHPSSSAHGSAAIEHVAGLGFGINSPLVTPARATLLRGGEAVTRRAGYQSIVITAAGYKIMPNTLIEPLQPFDEARILHLAMSLESEFGFAVDIEWSIDCDGELVLLQVRPITTVEVP